MDAHSLIDMLQVMNYARGLVLGFRGSNLGFRRLCVGFRGIHWEGGGGGRRGRSSGRKREL